MKHVRIETDKSKWTAVSAFIIVLATSGCTPVTPQVRQQAMQGCCQDMYVPGVCRPNMAIPGTLQCVPQQPQKSACINDPFRCDRLNVALVDNCQNRNYFRGMNAPCAIQVAHTAWDPNGRCIKGQCSVPVLVPSPPRPAPPPQ